MTAQAASAAVDIEAARRAIGDLVLRTPVLVADGLPADPGGSVVLKAESLQRTGSFKLRGVLSKIAALGDRAEAGLVTASAGNHGQAVAYAARARGLTCTVFMPREAPVSKVAAVEALGAVVRLVGDSVDDAIEHARREEARSGANFVHPYDDPHIVAGQATVGLELLEDVRGLRRVIVPVGGGGLAAGIGLAVKRQIPDAVLVGVQAAASPATARAFGAPGVAPAGAGEGASIADGICIKRPGGIALEILRDVADAMCVVSEDEIAQAMVFLAERAKLVAEGAGAAGVAALLAGRVPPVEGVTAVVVSGGNVDSSLLAAVLRRHESEAGRRVRMFTRVPDRPGGLAGLLGVVAAERANLLAIEHLREGLPLHVRETGVELTLETRGREHTDRVVNALREAGYDVHLDFGPEGEEAAEG